jgi:hypothetical protein
MDLNNVEYIVYDGFDSIRNALNTISNVYTNSEYTGLFFTAATLGVFMMLFTILSKRVSGVEVSPLAMLIPVISGLVIYVALFVPKTKLTVYDKSTGYLQTLK